MSEVAVVLGKLTPVDVGAVPNVFIGTVVDEMYCPVTYIFPLESTAILYPISVPLPLIVEYPASVPADLPEKLAPRKHWDPAVPPTSGKRS
jgi:hypothetical protein